MADNSDLIYRLRERARIRRTIIIRKSVQEGMPDRMADLLEEAALALSPQDKDRDPMAMECVQSTESGSACRCCQRRWGRDYVNRFIRNSSAD